MKEFKHLEVWVKDNAQKHVDKLTKILREDLSEAHFQWASEEQIDIIANLQETAKETRLHQIHFTKNERRGPWSSSKKDEDTIEDR